MRADRERERDRGEPAELAAPASRGGEPASWSAAGWFGAQVGCTLWIAILGARVWSSSAALGGVLLALFAAPTALGVLLWIARRRLGPHAALQALLALAGSAGALAAAVVKRYGTPLGIEPQLGVDPLAILLAFGALMLVFFLRDRLARRRAARGGGG